MLPDASGAATRNIVAASSPSWREAHFQARRLFVSLPTPSPVPVFEGHMVHRRLLAPTDTLRQLPVYDPD